MHPHPFIYFATLVLTLVAPLHAFEFRVVSWNGEITGLHFATGRTSTEIVSDEGLFSRSYRWNEPGPLVLFREIQQEDKTVRVTAATLTPPPDATRLILVLAPTDATRTTFTGLWIDDSAEARPPQTITVRNLSSLTVALRFGATERTLAGNEAFTLPTDPGKRRVPFRMAALTGQGWEVIASSSQEVRPGRRTLILLRNGHPQPSAATELIDMVTLNDRLPPPPPAPIVAGR